MEKSTYDVSDLVVLVIDEDPKMQQEMCDLLEGLGVKRVLCSADANYALDLLSDKTNQDQLDILVASCHLTGMSIKGLIKGVQIRKPDTIIIMYSTCEDPTTHARALILGSTDYFKKEPGYEVKVRKKLTSWIDIAVRNYEFNSMGPR